MAPIVKNGKVVSGVAAAVPPASTTATAARAATPAEQPATATATVPKPSTPAPRPAATAAPKPAAPKPAAPTGPAKQSPGAPRTSTYAQSYPEGMSAADFSYDDLGQSDATDIAPFEQYPTSRTIPGEGSTLYRERMPGPGKPVVQPAQAAFQVPSQYGLPAKTVYPSPPRPIEGRESAEFWYGPRSGFQSVAQFRDYAQSLGAALNDAERANDAVSRRLERAAKEDTTTRDEMQKLYDEQLARLRDVSTLRERLRRVGFEEGDISTVRAHAELRGEE
jgi:hypothetical protein